MELDDFDPEDKEILSWDINDMKLPQVCACRTAPSVWLCWLTINLPGSRKEPVRSYFRASTLFKGRCKA